MANLQTQPVASQPVESQTVADFDSLSQATTVENATDEDWESHSEKSECGSCDTDKGDLDLTDCWLQGMHAKPIKGRVNTWEIEKGTFEERMKHLRKTKRGLWGCVMDGDVHYETDAGGDIIYIDEDHYTPRSPLASPCPELEGETGVGCGGKGTSGKEKKVDADIKDLEHVDLPSRQKNVGRAETEEERPAMSGPNR